MRAIPNSTRAQRDEIGLRLFVSSAVFAIVIAVAYWLVAREPAGTMLLGFTAFGLTSSRLHDLADGKLICAAIRQPPAMPTRPARSSARTASAPRCRSQPQQRYIHRRGIGRVADDRGARHHIGARTGRILHRFKCLTIEAAASRAANGRRVSRFRAVGPRGAVSRSRTMKGAQTPRHGAPWSRWPCPAQPRPGGRGGSVCRRRKPEGIRACRGPSRKCSYRRRAPAKCVESFPLVQSVP